MTTTTQPRDPKTLVKGDLLYSALHGCFVRLVRWEGYWCVVADRNTMKELPDYVHESQIRQVR